MTIPAAPPEPPVLPISAGPPATAEPGWATTEWWATLVAMLVGLLTLLGVVHVDVGNPLVASEIQVVGGLLAMIVPAAAYAVGRSLRNSGTQG
jgi:hypothetical protein